jgi:Concanavalin A-like lectin/glucanases superfamily
MTFSRTRKLRGVRISQVQYKTSATIRGAALGSLLLLPLGCGQAGESGGGDFGDADSAEVSSSLSAWPLTPASAYEFDGVDDHIQAPDPAGLDVGSADFTVGAWVRPPADLPRGQSYVVLAKNAGTLMGSNHLAGYQLAVLRNNGDAYPHFQFLVNNGTAGVRIVSPLVTDGDWHHVAGVRSGNVFTLFVDGTPVATGTLSGSLNTTRPLMIGAWASPNAAGFAQGKIDEVSLHKRALPQAELRSFMSRGPSSNDSSLNLYYTFDGGTAQDGSQYGRNGSVNGSPLSTTGRAISDAAISFDGSSAIRMGSESETNFGTQPFSLSCFVRLDADPAGEQTILGRGVADPTRTGYRLSVGSGAFHFDLNQTGTQYRISSSSSTLRLGRWHHLVATRSGSILRLYVDGVQVAQRQDASTLNATTSSPFAVGASFVSAAAAPTRSLTGFVDNVVALSRALSATEVPTIRTKGLVSGEANLVKLLPFRKGSANDVSSFGRQATSVGTPRFVSGATVTRPEVDALSSGYEVPMSVLFTGATRLAVSNSDFQFTAQNFTLAASVRLRAEPNANQIQVLAGSGTAGATLAFRLALVGKFPAFQVATNAGVVSQAVSNVAIPLEEWAHVAAVRSGSTVKLYVNGVVRGELAFPSGTIPAVPFVVAGDNSGTPYALTGLLNNVGLYSSALSASQVLDVGNMGMDPTDPSLALYIPLRRKQLEDLGPKRRSISVTGVPVMAPGENFTTRTLSWNGTSTYVSTDSPAFNLKGSPFTVSGFFRTPAPGGPLQTLISKGFASGGDGYRLALQGGALSFAAKTGGATVAIVSASTITDSGWHHFGVVRGPNGPSKKDSVTLYLDGKYQGRADVPAGMTFSSPGRLAMGATLSSPVSSYFKGELDSIAFFGRPLLGKELQMQTDFGPDPQDSSLLALYPFEFASTLDVSAAEQHAELAGSTSSKAGVRFTGHDFMLDVWRRSNLKGMIPVPKEAQVTVDGSWLFTYDDLPSSPIDSTPPTPKVHGPYHSDHGDGGLSPVYTLARTDSFNMDYFTNGLSYGWANSGPINEYAALHGFSAVGVYNDATGARTVPDSTKFLLTAGFNEVAYLTTNNADNWDDLNQASESTLTGAWNESNPPSQYANYDWFVADMEAYLDRGTKEDPSDDFFGYAPNPSRGAAEIEGFRRSYRALAAAVKGNGKAVGNYGWSPAGARYFWPTAEGVPHQYPANVYPSTLANWETYNASITETVNFVNPSAYVTQPGFTPFIVMMNVAQARTLLNLRADLEQKKLLPFLWNNFHGNGSIDNWHAWNPFTFEEMQAAAFNVFFSGADGFVLWDAEPTNPNVELPQLGRFHRTKAAFDTGLPIKVGSAGAACGRNYPSPAAARQVKAYDPIYVLEVGENYVHYQVGLRDRNGFALTSCSSDCPECAGMSEEERQAYLRRRSLKEASQVDLYPAPSSPTFPIFKMSLAEFKDRMMPRGANLQATFKAVALAKWIERALYRGLPLDSAQATVDVNRQAETQRSVGFVGISESQYGPYILATPFDSAWENPALAKAKIQLRNVAGTGSTVTLTADQRVGYYVLFREP